MSILNWFRKPNITVNIPDDQTAATILKATIAIEFEIAQEKLKEAKTRVEAATADQLRAINLARPSRNVPVTVSYDGLEWICRMSNTVNPQFDLIGRGESPEQATLNFDYQWYGSNK